jgi:hypothetical protein
VRVTLIGWQSSALRYALKDSKELCSIDFPAFLTGKNEVAGIVPFGQPCL